MTNQRAPIWIEVAYQAQVTAIAVVVVVLYFVHVAPQARRIESAVERVETIEQRIEQLITPHLKDTESWQKVQRNR